MLSIPDKLRLWTQSAHPYLHTSRWENELGYIAASVIERLEARNAELVAALDKHHGTPCEQIRHVQEVDDLKVRNARLFNVLRELHATVMGESPSLLNEDSGGDAGLALEIDALLAAEKKE